jgi:hypothetical protein
VVAFAVTAVIREILELRRIYLRSRNDYSLERASSNSRHLILCLITVRRPCDTVIITSTPVEFLQQSARIAPLVLRTVKLLQPIRPESLSCFRYSKRTSPSRCQLSSASHVIITSRVKYQDEISYLQCFGTNVPRGIEVLLNPFPVAAEPEHRFRHVFISAIQLSCSRGQQLRPCQDAVLCRHSPRWKEQLDGKRVVMSIYNRSRRHACGCADGGAIGPQHPMEASWPRLPGVSFHLG